jgi:pyruvate/2-oxoglutarate dehydrogenase complex dihydrolipoamide acyltransferase (E2) component
MAVEPLIMPKLGIYTDDVLVAGWLVEEGQEIAAGTVVFELETDKTTAEVEAETSGFVHRLVAAGQSVPIGSAVALIAETREEYVDTAAGATVGEVPLATAEAGGRPPLVSPRARALLLRLGHTLEDASEITPTGSGGRIVDRDVVAWAAAREPVAAAPGEVGSGLTVRETIPLRGRRRTIATRMVASLQTAAQLTSVLEIDVKPLVELRAELNRDGARRVGVTAILVKLTATALREHSILNARVTETEIELLDDINVAVAVETDDGLVAPVIHGVDRLSIEQISARIDELSTRSRAGKLTPDDLEDGTFTLSNGGIHPVDITTAILNPPQTGILWVGRIRDRPVVVGDGAIVVRPTMQACLTFDHRAVDGGPAAAFLGTIERLIAALPELTS